MTSRFKLPSHIAISCYFAVKYIYFNKSIIIMDYNGYNPSQQFISSLKYNPIFIASTNIDMFSPSRCFLSTKSCRL